MPYFCRSPITQDWLDDETRKQNQDAFIKGDVHVMVATIAFGMGIDKADVRFVLHAVVAEGTCILLSGDWSFSGRDGLPSDCLLLFSHGDVEYHKLFQ